MIISLVDVCLGEDLQDEELGTLEKCLLLKIGKY